MDLIVRAGRSLTPIEIKSAATFTPDFTKGITRFQATVGDRASAGAVVYTGDHRLQFKGTWVFNPLAHDDLLGLVCPDARR